MADTSRSERSAVVAIASLLDEHRAEDTVALDVRSLCSWTDYFVITTVRSQTHLRGLVQWLAPLLKEWGLQPLGRYRNPSPDQGWVLIDCGSIVIHLMDRERRDFYELEKLWFQAEELYSSSSGSGRYRETGRAESLYSSKSS
jgi:ribosome-associated protein